jgi:hypothetical protein
MTSNAQTIERNLYDLIEFAVDVRECVYRQDFCMERVPFLAEKKKRK